MGERIETVIECFDCEYVGTNANDLMAHCETESHAGGVLFVTASRAVIVEDLEDIGHGD